MSVFSLYPAFLIVGAQKAATSSLYTYMIQHPSVVPPKQKEINFFNIDANYLKGNAYYHEQFNKFLNPFKKHVTFDATPEYLYLPEMPKRIFAYNPKMKLIVVLREPAERAYSAWNMFRKLSNLGTIPSVIEKPYIEGIPNNLKTLLFDQHFPSFEEIVRKEFAYMEKGSKFFEPSFVRRGLYADQLKRFMEYFPSDQLLILEHREVTDNLIQTLNSILRFVGLDDYHWSDLNTEIANKGSYIDKEPAVLRELKQFYHEPNQALFKLIDREFDWND